MQNKSVLSWVLCLAACAAAVWLFSQNRALRREIAQMRAERAAAEARRPPMEIPSRPARPARPEAPRSGKPDAPRPEMPVMAMTPTGERMDPAEQERFEEMRRLSEEERMDAAVNKRMAEMRKKADEERARRREAIAALTPEQKEEQREAFLGKMRERSQRRFVAFVANTGLDDQQAEAFESTIDEVDSSLSETAASWAEYIRENGSFSRDEQMVFAGQVGTVLNAAYAEMDSTLPESWRETEGDVNLMEIVGPEALSPMVEALTDAGLDDELQMIGQIMGGPGGGGGEAPEGFDGIESPGVGGGPGSMESPGGGPGGGPGGAPGMGDSGSEDSGADGSDL
jgi:hypothetical protein